MNTSDLTVYPKQLTDLIANTMAGSTRHVSGLTLSAHGAGSLQVDIAAGTCWVNGTFVSYAGGSVTPAGAPSTARYDCIRIANGATTPSIVQGTASSNPTLPALGTGDLFLGYIFLSAGAADYSSSTTAFINDYTLPFTLGNGSAARPSLPFANSLQMGSYRIADNQWGFSLNGSLAMTFTSTSLNVASPIKFQEAGNNVQPLTTLGDVVYASTAGKPDRLPMGTTGQVLLASTGGVPAWGAPLAAPVRAHLAADITMGTGGSASWNTIVCLDLASAAVYLTGGKVGMKAGQAGEHFLARIFDVTNSNIIDAAEQYSNGDGAINVIPLGFPVSTGATAVTLRLQALTNGTGGSTQILASTSTVGTSANFTGAWVQRVG